MDALYLPVLSAQPELDAAGRDALVEAMRLDKKRTGDGPRAGDVRRRDCRPSASTISACTEALEALDRLPASCA